MGHWIKGNISSDGMVSIKMGTLLIQVYISVYSDIEDERIRENSCLFIRNSKYFLETGQNITGFV